MLSNKNQSIKTKAGHLNPKLKGEKALEDITLTLTLGSVIFDLLVFSTPEPKTPIQIATHKNWISDLAKRMSAAKLKLNANEIEKLKEILDDDIKWQEIKITLEVNSELLEITSKGLELFTDILDSLVAIFS